MNSLYTMNYHIGNDKQVYIHVHVKIALIVVKSDASSRHVEWLTCSISFNFNKDINYFLKSYPTYFIIANPCDAACQMYDSIELVGFPANLNLLIHVAMLDINRGKV